MNSLMPIIEAKVHFYTNLLHLMEIFPDLRLIKEWWGNEKYYTEHIVPEKVEVFHSCGCCSDAPLLARFYTEVDGIEIYKMFDKQDSLYIGDKVDGGGDLPKDDWVNDLLKYDISDDLITEINYYFKNNKPTDEQEED